MKMGRPLKEFSREEFEKLCHIHCTKEEIYHWFATTEETLDKWIKRTYKDTFSPVYKRFADGGKASLRRHMFKLAQNGNLGACIFLAKNLLGMRDNFHLDAHHAHTHTHKISEESKAALIKEVQEVLSTIEECKAAGTPPPRLALPILQ